eukprot:TRINITY_DN2663_c0_g1_i1.p1 TRINITY_DN2663_c0_g1~~TRINITY_DN2663_c0_g1_i1.p1  ORF type:complete len:2655 (-),score=379.56 TRINITY_DN2663_c0_g1_i1:23-7987(-)
MATPANTSGLLGVTLCSATVTLPAGEPDDWHCVVSLAEDSANGQELALGVPVELRVPCVGSDRVSVPSASLRVFVIGDGDQNHAKAELLLTALAAGAATEVVVPVLGAAEGWITLSLSARGFGEPHYQVGGEERGSGRGLLRVAVRANADSASIAGAAVVVLTVERTQRQFVLDRQDAVDFVVPLDAGTCTSDLEIAVFASSGCKPEPPGWHSLGKGLIPLSSLVCRTPQQLTFHLHTGTLAVSLEALDFGRPGQAGGDTDDDRPSRRRSSSASSSQRVAKPICRLRALVERVDLPAEDETQRFLRLGVGRAQLHRTSSQLASGALWDDEEFSFVILGEPATAEDGRSYITSFHALRLEVWDQTPHEPQAELIGTASLSLDKLSGGKSRHIVPVDGQQGGIHVQLDAEGFGLPVTNEALREPEPPASNGSPTPGAREVEVPPLRTAPGAGRLKVTVLHVEWDSANASGVSAAVVFGQQRRETALHSAQDQWDEETFLFLVPTYDDGHAVVSDGVAEVFLIDHAGEEIGCGDLSLNDLRHSTAELRRVALGNGNGLVHLRVEAVDFGQANVSTCVFEVVVEGARGLLDADGLGSSDPFVVLSVGRQQRMTSVQHGTCDPTWNETLGFDLPLDTRGQTPAQLLIKVFNQDMGATADYLGEAAVDIEPLWRHPNSLLDIPLRYKGVDAGSIQLRFRVPTEEPEERPAQQSARASLGSATTETAQEATALQSFRLYATVINVVGLEEALRAVSVGRRVRTVTVELACDPHLPEQRTSERLTNSMDWYETLEFDVPTATGTPATAPPLRVDVLGIPEDDGLAPEGGCALLGRAYVPLNLLENEAVETLTAKLPCGGEVQLALMCVLPSPSASASPSQSPKTASPRTPGKPEFEDARGPPSRGWLRVTMQNGGHMNRGRWGQKPIVNLRVDEDVFQTKPGILTQHDEGYWAPVWREDFDFLVPLKERPSGPYETALVCPCTLQLTVADASYSTEYGVLTGAIPLDTLAKKNATDVVVHLAPLGSSPTASVFLTLEATDFGLGLLGDSEDGDQKTDSGTNGEGPARPQSPEYSDLVDKQRLLEEEWAATKIQALHRGARVRQELRRKFDAVAQPTPAPAAPKVSSPAALQSQGALRGEVQLAPHFPSGSHLRVVLVRATGIALCGDGREPDAFAVLGLGVERRISAIREKSSNPEWREEFVLSLPQKAVGSDGSPALLRVQVFDRSTVQHGPLGYTATPILGLEPGHKEDRLLSLQPGHVQLELELVVAKDDAPATTSLAQSPAPIGRQSPINTEPAASAPGRGSLLIIVASATNLFDAGLDGTSDPYLRLSVGSQQFSTATKPGTLDPVWNEEFTFAVPLEPHPAPRFGSTVLRCPEELRLEVWHNGLGVEEDALLGKALVSLALLRRGQITDIHARLPIQGEVHLQLYPRDFGVEPANAPARTDGPAPKEAEPHKALPRTPAPADQSFVILEPHLPSAEVDISTIPSSIHSSAGSSDFGAYPPSEPPSGIGSPVQPRAQSRGAEEKPLWRSAIEQEIEERHRLRQQAEALRARKLEDKFERQSEIKERIEKQKEESRRREGELREREMRRKEVLDRTKEARTSPRSGAAKAENNDGQPADQPAGQQTVVAAPPGKPRPQLNKKIPLVSPRLEILLRPRQGDSAETTVVRKTNSPVERSSDAASSSRRFSPARRLSARSETPETPTTKRTPRKNSAGTAAKKPEGPLRSPRNGHQQAKPSSASSPGVYRRSRSLPMSPERFKSAQTSLSREGSPAEREKDEQPFAMDGTASPARDYQAFMRLAGYEPPPRALTPASPDQQARASAAKEATGAASARASSPPKVRTRQGNPTTLHDACRLGDVIAVRRMIATASPQELAQKDNMGNTALHVAAMHGFLPVVLALLQSRPELGQIQNTLGKTPGQVAAENGHKHIGFALAKDHARQTVGLLQSNTVVVSDPRWAGVLTGLLASAEQLTTLDLTNLAASASSEESIEEILHYLQLSRSVRELLLPQLGIGSYRALVELLTASQAPPLERIALRLSGVVEDAPAADKPQAVLDPRNVASGEAALWKALGEDREATRNLRSLHLQGSVIAAKQLWDLFPSLEAACAAPEWGRNARAAQHLVISHLHCTRLPHPTLPFPALPNPFVILRHGSRALSTTAKLKTGTASWENQEFSFPVTAGTSLSIEVWHTEEGNSPTELLGRATLPIAGLRPTHPQPVSVPILECGEVHLQIELREGGSIETAVPQSPTVGRGKLIAIIRQGEGFTPGHAVALRVGTLHDAQQFRTSFQEASTAVWNEEFALLVRTCPSVDSDGNSISISTDGLVLSLFESSGDLLQDSSPTKSTEPTGNDTVIPLAMLRTGRSETAWVDLAQYGRVQVTLRAVDFGRAAEEPTHKAPATALNHSRLHELRLTSSCEDIVEFLQNAGNSPFLPDNLVLHCTTPPTALSLRELCQCLRLSQYLRDLEIYNAAFEERFTALHRSSVSWEKDRAVQIVKDNRQGDTLAKALSDALGCASRPLRKLSLRWWCLSDVGAQAILRALAENSSVQELEITGPSSIGRESLVALSALLLPARDRQPQRESALLRMRITLRDAQYLDSKALKMLQAALSGNSTLETLEINIGLCEDRLEQQVKSPIPDARLRVLGHPKWIAHVAK